MERQYDMAAGREWVVTPVFGRESDRLSYNLRTPGGLRELRERVAELRRMGFRRGKIRGGLGRVLRMLGDR